MHRLKTLRRLHTIRSFDQKPSSKPDYHLYTSKQQRTSTNQTLPSTQPNSDNQLGRCSKFNRCAVVSGQRQRLCPGPIVEKYDAQNGLLKVLGLHTTKIIHRGATFAVDFVVIDEPGQPPILGLPSCYKLNLIRRVDAVQSTPVTQPPPIVVKYMDVFNSLGKLRT